MPVSTRPASFRRDTLVAKVEKLCYGAAKVDLPATIEEVRVFGGFLRVKEKLKDVDILVIMSQTPEQEARWDQFDANFDGWGSTPFMEELRDVANESYSDLAIPLSRAVNGERVSSLLRKHKVNPDWFGCYSWTVVLRGQRGDGMFFVHLNEVVATMLRRIAGRGLDIHPRLGLEEAGSAIRMDDTVLAWSRGRPDVAKNLNVGGSERADMLKREHAHFVEQIAKVGVGIRGPEQKYQELVRELKSANTMGLRIDVDALTSSHAIPPLSGDENLEDLSGKVEEARTVLRNYESDNVVLSSVIGAIERVKEGARIGQTLEQTVAALAMNWSKRVDERERRRILRTLGLPEEKIVKDFGFYRAEGEG